ANSPVEPSGVSPCTPAPIRSDASRPSTSVLMRPFASIGDTRYGNTPWKSWLFMARVLTGKPAFVEERLLLDRRDAAEHGIAMREAAEACDDVVMHLRPLQAVGVARGRIERDAPVLVRHVLGVLERQIEERAQVGRHLSVEAAQQRRSRDGARLRVGGKGAGGAAE